MISDLKMTKEVGFEPLHKELCKGLANLRFKPLSHSFLMIQFYG